MIKKNLAFELCTNDIAAVKMAAQEGYRRIELCSAIEIGGLTSSPGLIKKCSSIKDIEIHVLLRHRAGNFTYNQSDLEIFLSDVEMVKKNGAKGVVTGCLTEHNEIDLRLCNALANHCHKLQLDISFHRAFDFVKNMEFALESLIDLGYRRILTSGQSINALKGLPTLSWLVEKAEGRIEIMAAGGINTNNAKMIASSGVDALHYTAMKTMAEMELGMGQIYIPDVKKIKAIPALFKTRQ